MKGRSLIGWVGLMVCVMGTGCATKKVDKNSPLMATEQKFMVLAAQDSASEVTAGQLAAERATNPQVKQFAQRMVRDHTSMNEEIAQLGKTKGLKLPTRPDEQHMQETSMLGQMQGAEFDKAYMSAQVADHAKTVSKFEDIAQSASDPEVKAFAQRHSGMMRQHLDEARRINQSLGGAAGSGTGTGSTSTDANRVGGARTGTGSGTGSGTNTTPGGTGTGTGGTRTGGTGAGGTGTNTDGTNR